MSTPSVNKNNMYSKTTFIFSFLFLIAFTSNAQNTAICTAAKDSMKTQFKRGELNFYLPSKSNPKVVNYYKITKDNYQKIQVKNAPVTAVIKDTAAGSKELSMKIGMDAGKPSATKSQTLDTSADFKRCYNEAFQSKLDSVFKCDFFRKTDSILKSYDKLGKGYKNVDFPGGAGALQKFLDKNVVLPKDAKPSDTDKLYKVYYSFFVDEKGALSDISMIKSNCKACEESIVAAIKKLPAFLPATDAGKPKKVKYILPYTKPYIKPKE